MQTTHSPVPDLRRLARSAGYGLAVLLDLVLLVVVLYLLEWGVLPFLTGEFAEVVPWIALSLLVSAGANLVYVFDDRLPIRRIGDIATNLTGLVATYRLFAVFPFDFSAYGFDWGSLARLVLLVGMAGAMIGVIVAFTKLVAWAATPDEIGRSA